jgi:phosphate/sulfate permease
MVIAIPILCLAIAIGAYKLGERDAEARAKKAKALTTKQFITVTDDGEGVSEAVRAYLARKAQAVTFRDGE